MLRLPQFSDIGIKTLFPFSLTRKDHQHVHVCTIGTLCIRDLDKLNLVWFGFKLKPISGNYRAPSPKIDTVVNIQSGLKWHKNNHIVTYTKVESKPVKHSVQERPTQNLFHLLLIVLSEKYLKLSLNWNRGTTNVWWIVLNFRERKKMCFSHQYFVCFRFAFRLLIEWGSREICGH